MISTSSPEPVVSMGGLQRGSSVSFADVELDARVTGTKPAGMYREAMLRSPRIVTPPIPRRTVMARVEKPKATSGSTLNGGIAPPALRLG